MLLHELGKPVVNHFRVHPDDAANCRVQTFRVRKILLQVIEVQPRLLRQNQRTEIVQVLFAYRLAQPDLSKCFIFFDQRHQDIVNASPIGNHLHLIEFADFDLMAIQLISRSVFGDVHDLGLRTGRRVLAAVLGNAAQFSPNLFQIGSSDVLPELGALHFLDQRHFDFYLTQVASQGRNPIDQFVFAIVSAGSLQQATCLQPRNQDIKAIRIVMARNVTPLHQRSHVLLQCRFGRRIE